MQTKALEKLQRFASQRRWQIVLVIAVLAISLIIRLLLFRYHGYYIDENCFKAWYNTAAETGLRHFYDSTWCDYPPFNIYIFWIFGNLAHTIGPNSLDFLIKLPQNLFDLATAYLIFRFVRSNYSFLPALIAMTVYAFNPAIIFDLAVWGQFDSIYTFFMIASLYALMRSRYEISGALFSLAILTKPQSIILLPVLAYIILRNGRWKRAISSGLVSIASVFLFIAPFNWNGGPITFLIDKYSGYGVYPYNSINAYNFWALRGFWKWDGGGEPPRIDMLSIPHSFLGMSYQMWGVIAFLVLTAFVIWQLHRRYEQKSAVFAVFLLMFGFFMIMTRMHERYLFPVFALLALGWAGRFTFKSFTTWLYLGITGTFLANLVYVMAQLKAGAFIPDGHWSLYVLAPLNIILFVSAMVYFWRMQCCKPAIEELR